MHVVEFGSNEIGGIFPARSFNPYSVSLIVRDGLKLIAFLIDAKTLQVHDLVRQKDTDTIEHSKRIDWLVEY